MFKVCTTQYGYSWDTRIIPGHTTKIIFTEKQQTDLIIPKSFIKKINMYSCSFFIAVSKPSPQAGVFLDTIENNILIYHSR